MRRVLSVPAMTLAVYLAAACVGDTAVTPAPEPIGAQRIGACSVKPASAAVDWSNGPVRVSGIFRATGWVGAGAVRRALVPHSVPERIVIPENDDLDHLAGEVAEVVVRTYPARESKYEYDVPVRAFRGIFEPKCRYRVAFRVGTRDFGVELEAGEGRWVLGVANSSGGYVGPVSS